MADDLITIASDVLTARINPLGAELTHLTDAEGRELMTDADPAYWTGHAPILFPIVGRLNDDTLRLDGHAYAMGQHGFARRSTFVVAAQDAASVTFRLAADAETRKHYPFDFVLEIRFALTDATLDVVATIANPGPDPLPASFGFHPAFAWPLPYGMARSDHRVTFSDEEATTIRVLDEQGTITPERRPTPLDGRTLAPTDELFARDALIWDRLASDHVVYGVEGAPRLRVAFPDTPFLGIWTKPGAHFLCIEPWHGIADPQGFEGDFRDKPGVFAVAPGAERRIAMQIALVR